MSFIFGQGTDLTYEQMKKQREIAEVLAAQTMGRTPRNVGEGISAIGNALAYRGMSKRADAAEKKGRAGADELYASLLGGGQGSFATGVGGGNTERTARNNILAAHGGPSPAALDAWNSATAGDFITYANEGATRNLPLSEDLTAALSFLPEMGLGVEVFSGGQPGIGEGGARVGATNHDHGNAGDVFITKDGQRLDWANPEHQPIFNEIVQRGKASGLHFGAGDGYMQPGSLHVGVGNPRIWGADGKGDNAAPWLKQAWSGPGTQVAQANGGIDPRLLQALSNQYMNPGQRAVVQSLIQQQMAASAPMTPHQRAQLAMQQQRFDADQNKPKQRPTAKAADGYLYYLDGDKERVYGNVEAKPSAPLVQFTEQNAYSKDRGKNAAAFMKELETEALAGQSALMSLQVMSEAMSQPGFYSGIGGDGAALQAKRLARAFGLEVEGIDSMEAFNSQAKAAALEAMGGSLGAGFSDADRTFVTDQVPNLSNTPEGNQAIVEIQTRIQQRKVEMLKLAQEFERENGTIAGFAYELAQWANENPVFSPDDPAFSAPVAAVPAPGGAAAPVAPTPTAPTGPQAAPQTFMDTMKAADPNVPPEAWLKIWNSLSEEDKASWGAP